MGQLKSRKGSGHAARYVRNRIQARLCEFSSQDDELEDFLGLGKSSECALLDMQALQSHEKEQSWIKLLFKAKPQQFWKCWVDRAMCAGGWRYQK